MFWPKFTFFTAVADVLVLFLFLVLLQKDKLLIHILHSECVSLVLTIMGRLLKQELYAKLTAKELPGTRIELCNQLDDKDLVLGENCKSF